VIPEEPQPEASSAANAPAPAANVTPPEAPPANVTSPEAPQATVDVATAPSLDIVSGDGNAALKGVLSPVTASPLLPTVKSSSGVSGGALEHQVKPAYPPEALKLKRAGRVVLQAVITKDGTVRGLKVIDGDSLLARAAMDAVAQWRYQPYVLNGEPIDRTTEITIVFKLQ
jgi:protein TonB